MLGKNLNYNRKAFRRARKREKRRNRKEGEKGRLGAEMANSRALKTGASKSWR